MTDSLGSDKAIAGSSGQTSGWTRFKARRLGYWSFWIFVVLVVTSLVAEFIANDKPLVIRYAGKTYLPIFVSYLDSDFGGGFDAPADYRDPFVRKQIEDAGGTMLWPPIRFSYNTHDLGFTTDGASKPTWLFTAQDCTAMRDGDAACRNVDSHWLGTDDQKRDILARLIYGFRFAAAVGLAAALVCFVIGFTARAAFGTPWPDAAARAATISPAAFLLSVGLLIVLDFFFLGVPLSWPSLGQLLWTARDDPHPWIWIPVAVTISLLFALTYFIGRAIRDALDV